MILKRLSNVTQGNNVLASVTNEDTCNAASFEDDSSFATIDGGVITQNEVEMAVNNGAGIFIGNYFVGIVESYQCYINSPFGRFS